MICAALYKHTKEENNEVRKIEGKKNKQLFSSSFFSVLWCFVNFTRQGRECEEKSEKAVKGSIVFFEVV